MRKKLLTGLLIVCMAFGIAGCDNKDNSTNVADVQNSGEEAHDEAGEVMEIDNEDEADLSKEEESVSDEYACGVLYDDMFNYTLVYVDDEGNTTKNVQLRKLLNLKDNGIIDLKYVDNSVVYYTQYGDCDFGVYCYDLETDNKRTVCNMEDGYVTVDVYEDKIYIEDPYNEENPLKVYDKNTLEPADFDDSVYNAVDGYSIDLPKGDFDNDCVARTLATTGNRLVLDKFEDGTHYYLYDNGEISPLDIGVEDYSVLDYDTDSIVYSVWDSVDYTYSLGIYNYVTKKNEEITSEYDSFLAYKDGSVYWMERDDSEYGRDKYTCMVYDKESKTVTEAYSFRKNPVVLDTPGMLGFNVYNGNIYCIGDNDNLEDWYVAKRTGDSYELSRLNINNEKRPLFDLGHVEYVSGTRNCEKCGEPVSKYYGEYFVLNDMYENAPSINSVIKEYIDSSYNFAMEDSADDEYGDCEFHGETAGLVTEDDIVSDVKIIGGNYLTVAYGGYWYGGGAHGMPSQRFYLFDLSTGKEISFNDLYSGTTEELADLIGKKAMEMVDSEFGSPFYSDDKDEVYNSVVESVTGGFYDVIYYDDCVEISFSPYDLGPYASGYINIEITYEELGIDEFSLS